MTLTPIIARDSLDLIGTERPGCQVELHPTDSVTLLDRGAGLDRVAKETAPGPLRSSHPSV
jgi:hypothetical protein